MVIAFNSYKWRAKIFAYFSSPRVIGSQQVAT